MLTWFRFPDLVNLVILSVFGLCYPYQVIRRGAASELVDCTLKLLHFTRPFSQRFRSWSLPTIYLFEYG